MEDPISMSLLPLKYTAEAILCAFLTRQRAHEYLMVIAQLDEFLHALNAAVTDIVAHQSQLATSSSNASYALEFAAVIITSLNKCLEDAYDEEKFWRQWNADESTQYLKDSRNVMTSALASAVTVLTAMMAMEAEARLTGDMGSLLQDITLLKEEQRELKLASATNLMEIFKQLTWHHQAFKGLTLDRLGPQEASRLFVNDASTDRLADTLFAFRLQQMQQCNTSALTCPLTGDWMVDPVVANNGRTYCRFSLFHALDHNIKIPGCKDNSDFEIIGSNSDVLKAIFDVVPGARANLQACRLEYVNSVSEAEAEGNLRAARIRAKRALQLLPLDDVRRPAMRATLERVTPCPTPELNTSASVFTCPISGEPMIDPVVASNGRTYCRFSLFHSMDEGTPIPGFAPGEPVKIWGNNLEMRQKIFDAIPGSEQLWHVKQSNYLDSVTAAEANGDAVTARLRAERALQFFSPDDVHVLALRATLERLPARSTVKVDEVRHVVSGSQDGDRSPIQSTEGSFEQLKVGRDIHTIPEHNAQKVNRAPSLKLVQAELSTTSMGTPSTQTPTSVSSGQSTASPWSGLQSEKPPSLTRIARKLTGKSKRPPQQPPTLKPCVLARMMGRFAVLDANQPKSSWQLHGTWPLSVSRDTACVLQSGQILKIGFGGSKPTTRVAKLVTIPATAKVNRANTTPPTTLRFGSALAALPDGKALLAGGIADASLPVCKHTNLASTEVFDPDTSTWRPASDMAVARSFFAMTRLPGNRIIAIGGRGCGTSCEIYDCDSGTWAPAPSRDSSAGQPAAALLPDGRVVVVDKYNVEFFRPFADTGSDGCWNPGPPLPPALQGVQKHVAPLPSGFIVTQVEPKAESWEEHKSMQSFIYDTSCAHKTPDDPWIQGSSIQGKTIEFLLSLSLPQDLLG